ncbi:MAG: DUF2156 domain-containing protein [Microbacteriaceae bacterium]|nr:DUF2156 domain-containing protein [Microbacteriaceae bacterium]
MTTSKDAPRTRPTLRAHLRRHPFSSALTALYIAVALATGPRGPDALLRQRLWVVLGTDEPVRHWWAPVTSMFFAGGLVKLGLAVAGAIVLIGAAETLMGWRRTALAFVVTSVVGVTVGAGLIVLGEFGHVPWAQSIDRIATVDPQAGVFGTITTASAFAGQLWRRRIRTFTALTAIVFVLYSGEPADVYRLVATAAGFGLGLLLHRAPRRAGWTRSSSHEKRMLLATATAITAVGPVIALVSRTRVGLLGPIGVLFATPGVVHTQAGATRCELFALTRACVQQLSTAHSDRPGQLIVSLAPLALLLLAALGLAQGRRAAVWLGAAVSAALGILAAFFFGIVPADVFGPQVGGTYRDVQFSVGAVLAIALPLALAVALVLSRRDFPLRWGDAVERGLQQDAAHARALVLLGGDGLSFMATWPGNTYWFDPDDPEAGVAYRVVGRVAVTSGGPIGRPADAAATIARFARFCDDAGRTPVFYSVDAALRPVFARLGWQARTVAEEAVIDAHTFDLAGRSKQKVRSAVNRAQREGLRAIWCAHHELPWHLARQLVAISEEWVAAKELPEMGFTLGGLAEARDPAVRLMVTVDADDRVLAFTSWLPVHRDGVLVGYTNDLLRRRPDAPHGAMEFTIAEVAARLRNDGLERLSLSAAPLARSAQTSADAIDAMLDGLSTRLEPVYGFRSLLDFKRKFQPELRPLLIAYPDAVALPAIGLALVRAYLPTLSLRQASGLVRGLSTHDRAPVPSPAPAP